MIVKRDLKNILEINTIVFENVPDLDGDTNLPDGTPRVWKIRPLTVEQEHAVERARAKNTSYLQRLIATNARFWEAAKEGKALSVPAEEETSEEELDPLATAEQWAPIVAAIVAEPQLDAEELVTQFHGLILRLVGEEAEAFFQATNERAKKDREQKKK